MKNKAYKLIFNYTLTIIFIALMVLMLNYAMLLYFIRCSPYIKEPTKTVKIVAQELSSKHKKLSTSTLEIIKNNNLWIQLVNPTGQVIYSYNQPKDIGKVYSLKEIAGLSRNYLKDYPVFVWESKENLVIVGYPKNSMTKYNWFVPTNTKNNLSFTFIAMFSFNIFFTILLSILLGRIFNKPLSALIKGVFSLKEEKKIILQERGIYKDLAKSINETAQMISEKNEKLQLRDKAIKNWISSISHDVRTPLSMILGYASMMEEEALSEEVQAQAKIITENALSLRELVTNLNLATSLQYDMQPLSLTNIRIGNLVREAMVSCINSGVLQHCTKELIVEAEEIEMLADKKLLQRALINLMMNSAKHNKAGCHITLTVPKVEEHNPYAFIILSDNGSGIPKDKLTKLKSQEGFQPTYQEEHGLGLIIVKSIIKAHRGIFVIENGKDKGVVAKIKIPKAIKKKTQEN